MVKEKLQERLESDWNESQANKRKTDKRKKDRKEKLFEPDGNQGSK